MSSKIDVISLGIGELGERARQQLANADTVIGSQRQLDLVSRYCPNSNQRSLPSPVSKLAALIGELPSSNIAVLASGDGLFYGIGSLLIQTLGRERLAFHPNISSIQACMHLIGLPWQDATIFSLHGRPMSNLRRYFSPHSLFGIFTDQINHPAAIARELVALGFGEAEIWVGEALGTERQSLNQFSASRLSTRQDPFHPINVVVLRSGANHAALPTFPGVPDHLFSTGSEPGFGMISKREVRLAILSFMQPAPGQIAWDIGAGCGSVSVEWARWNPRGEIYAVESDQSRVQHINANRLKFGVEQNCHVIAGQAPEQCTHLPDPNTVFIGGNSGNLPQLLECSWTRLKSGGVLVASAVTEESQSVLMQYADHQRAQGAPVEWAEIAVRKNLPHQSEVRSLLPVQLISCRKL